MVNAGPSEFRMLILFERNGFEERVSEVVSKWQTNAKLLCEFAFVSEKCSK